MAKNTYNQPSIKVIELKTTTILAGSNIFDIYNEEVLPSQDPDTEENGWGTQW